MAPSVMRLIDKSRTTPTLESLGLSEAMREKLSEIIKRPTGALLVTGPTGSGKSTTLYAALAQINHPEINIITVEDPVEYRLPGVVQVQVNEKAGLTFPAALRSILRQDPDVILVGEVRDKETASITVQASLTGHMVLSTLHTIDAASSITRLVDIGVETYKIAAALKGVLAQRLVRRLCPHCRELEVGQVPERLRKWFPQGVTLYRAVGCSDCSQTGYRGRLALTEILVMSVELERRIAANEPADRIADAARESGMRGLWESGVQHVRNGTTSVEELLRVVERLHGEPQAARAGTRCRA